MGTKGTLNDLQLDAQIHVIYFSKSILGIHYGKLIHHMAA
jgi:hypothetical protein